MQRKFLSVGTLQVAAGSALFAMIASVPGAHAATIVETIDPTTITNAYVNVFTLTGGYEYGYQNSLAANPATFNGNNLTVGVNSNASDGSPPTAPGTAQIQASTYAENEALSGNTVTFNFTVTADSLLAPYTETAFVGDFAPNFSSSVQQQVVVTGPGNYTISLATVAGDPIQYGFVTAGPNSTDAIAPTLGSVTVAPFTAAAVPEPASLGAVALAAAGLFRRRRA